MSSPKRVLIAARTGSTLYFTHDPAEAVREADVIYTDVWTSMGQEAETQRRLEIFSPKYQINAALVAKAHRNAIVMHCLPAHRGQEITDEVADGSHSALWDQAENRMHAQKAILVDLLAPDYAAEIKARSAKATKSAKPTTRAAAKPTAKSSAKSAAKPATRSKAIKPATKRKR